jgi:hypothetical protein
VAEARTSTIAGVVLAENQYKKRRAAFCISATRRFLTKEGKECPDNSDQSKVQARKETTRGKSKTLIREKCG